MWMEQFFNYFRESTFAEPQIEDALALKEKHLPRYIYKYRRGDVRDLNSLRNGTVWLRPPESYNDVYDCWLTMPTRVIESLVEKAVSDELAKVSRIQNLSEEQVETFSTKSRDWGKEVAARILEWRKMMEFSCFNTVGDSLIMWAHYAADHKGFCIEYDIEPLSTNHPLRKDLYPVWYTDQLFDLTPYGRGLTNPDRGSFNVFYPMLGILCIFTGWSYENEWRVVKVRGEKTKGRELQVPAPSRILLGARFDAAAIPGLLEVCKENKIPAYQMHIANDRFALLPKLLVD